MAPRSRLNFSRQVRGVLIDSWIIWGAIEVPRRDSRVCRMEDLAVLIRAGRVSAGMPFRSFASVVVEDGR